MNRSAANRINPAFGEWGILSKKSQLEDATSQSGGVGEGMSFGLYFVLELSASKTAVNRVRYELRNSKHHVHFHL